MSVSRNSLNQYKAVDINTRVNSASPHRLIQLLFEKFLDEVAIARLLIERNEMGKKAAHISKAHSIIEGLQLSLDKQAGGEISENLENLYMYIGDRLLEINQHGDIHKLDEVCALIQQVKQGWDGIAPPAQSNREPGKGENTGPGDLFVGA